MKYEQIEKMRESLQAMPKKDKREKSLSTREVMSELAKDFEQLLHKGYSYDEIAEHLEKSGLTVKPSSIEYNVKKRRRQNKRPAKQSSKSPPSPALATKSPPKAPEKKATATAFNPLREDSKKL